MGCACGKPLRRTSRGYAHADKGRGGGAGGGGSGSPVSRSSSLASRRLVTPPAKPDADAEADADEAELSNFGHGEQIKHQKLKPKPYHINSNANGAGAPVALLSDDAEKQRQSQSQSHGHGQSQRLRQRQRQHYQSHYAEDSRPRQQQQQQLHAEFGANANLHFRNGRRCAEAEQVAAERRYVEGEQMAAGWPVWLTAVAGEAIHGWIPRRADSFEKLDKIGQGTYSNVYKARDLETGKIVALKKVRFDNLEPDSVRFMAREIQVLRRLDHPNVVKLEGLVTSRMSCSLYLVFEYMEHDLAGLAACPGIKFTEAQVKCYMQQLLKGLDHCHSRGVLHRDIKGSNLLLDNSGILKIADFGLATFFHPDQRQPLTSRVVTLWYRPPELLLGATEYGVAVDLWSTGCILAELLAGKPIMPGRTEVEQLHKIFKLCGSPSEEYWKRSKLPHATIFKPQQPYKRCVSDTFKDYPASALALIEVLLAIEPCNRGTAALALKSEFFTTKPLPCDPASLPKYPPCKEFDAKIRDEEARKRHRVSGARAHHDGGRRAAQESRAVAQESRAVPAPDANAELAVSIQKRRAMMQGPSKSKSEKFNARQDDGAVGFPIEPPRVTHLSSETTGNSEFTHQIGPSQGVPNSKSSSFWTKKQREDDFQGLSSHQSLNTSKSLLVMDLKKQGTCGLQMTEEATHLPGVPAGRSNIAVDAHRECGAVRQNNGIDIAQNSGSYGVREHTEYLKTTERASFQCTASFKGLDDYCPQDPQGTHQRDERVLCKESTVKWSSYASQGDNRMHYSGPLLPPTGNIDAILKEHERHIQHAVRRARQDKGRVQKSNFAQSKKKNLEQNYLNSDSNGHVMFSDYASDMPSTTSNNSFKSKIRVSEEIVELKDSEREPLSSVMESYERESDG